MDRKCYCLIKTQILFVNNKIIYVMIHSLLKMSKQQKRYEKYTRVLVNGIMGLEMEARLIRHFFESRYRALLLFTIGAIAIGTCTFLLEVAYCVLPNVHISKQSFLLNSMVICVYHRAHQHR